MGRARRWLCASGGLAYPDSRRHAKQHPSIGAWSPKPCCLHASPCRWLAAHSSCSSMRCSTPCSGRPGGGRGGGMAGDDQRGRENQPDCRLVISSPTGLVPMWSPSLVHSRTPRDPLPQMSPPSGCLNTTPAISTYPHRLLPALPSASSPGLGPVGCARTARPTCRTRCSSWTR